MSDSEKSFVADDSADLNNKKAEASENSKVNAAVSASVGGGAFAPACGMDIKGKEKRAAAAEGGDADGSEQRCNEDPATAGDGPSVTKPPKFQLFSGTNLQPYPNQKASAEYLARLIEEKGDLDALPNIFQFKHVVRLVNDEIAKVHEELGEMVDGNDDDSKNGDDGNSGQGEAIKETSAPAATGKKVFLQEKIFVPVNEYPNYNFVGRILGPRGMTAKQLEEESGCRIMIRGRGSTRDNGYHRQNMYNDHLKEELHVLVQCEDVEEVAKEKVKRAVECIRYMLIPPPEGEDELKRKQLMELSIINGTYRPTSTSRMALHNRPLLPSLNFGQVGADGSIHRMNSVQGYANGGVEDEKQAAYYDHRSGMTVPYGTAQQYSYNAYTVNTRQALASLGFDMDAFEIADYYGKRISKPPTAIPGVPAAAATAAAVQYPRPYGIGAPVMDPFTMQQYVWNPPMNSSMFNVFENSSNALAKEYCNQVMAGLSPGVGGVNGATLGDGVAAAQSPNVPPVNLQQYITAAALLSGAPTFRNDGSGDGPGNYR